MRCYENIIELIVSPVDIQMTAKEYEYIADIVCSRNGCNLLVFGVGRDSALWLIANQGGKTVFLEDSDKWLDKAKKEIPQIDARKITYCTKRSDWKEIYRRGDSVDRLNLPEDVLNTEWDVIVVDGPNGNSDNAPGRMLSISAASRLGRSKLGADIFIHDFDREVEQVYARRYFGWDEKIKAFDKLIHFQTKRKEPLKILFATTHSYSPQRVGGAGSSTHDACTMLIESGYECAVLADLTAGDDIWNENRKLAQERHKNYPCDKINGYPVYRGVNPMAGVDEVIGEFKPDIVIIMAGESAQFAKVFRARQIPTIVRIVDVIFERHGGAHATQSGIKYMTNSEFASRRLKENYNIPSIPIVPYIKQERYRTDTSRRKVLYVCPHPKKGVEIAFRLAEFNPDIEFIFLESWPLGPKRKDEYMSRAEKYDNIEWRPFQRDMKEFYSQAKIVLVPSVCEESWGRVVTEAQVSGIPALASNIGGLPESVSDGGILVDPEDDINVWSAALRKLFNDDDCYRKLSENAYHASQREILQKEYIFAQLVSLINQSLLDVDDTFMHRV